MNKNTVWAIVLSVLVLVVFTFLQPLINPVNTNVTEAVEATEEVVAPVVEPTKPVLGDVDDLEDQFFIEENFTITTEKVKVTFTNRGGDIILSLRKNKIFRKG